MYPARGRSCAPKVVAIKGHLELMLDRPDGHPIQIFRCIFCGSERACRPGWTMRCHACLDDRTAQVWLDDAETAYRDWLAGMDAHEASEVERELCAYAMCDNRELDALDIASFLAADTLAFEMDRRAQSGLTLLATDLWGAPWTYDPDRKISHGTWATHDACGRVGKLAPGRGHTECQFCPPDSSSRAHRGRQNDKHLLYLVGFDNLIKFGHGDEARVRAHVRAGATVIQVIEASHSEVVRSELVLKRKYARIKRRTSARRMPTTFGAGTEVLPRSMTFNLNDLITGADVSHRYR